MKIETKAYRSGYYGGLPVWRGKFRVLQLSDGFEVGWCLATNTQGLPIAYSDKETALAGARLCGEKLAGGVGASPAAPWAIDHAR